MKLFNIFLASTILASGLSSSELKRSMKVVPMEPKYLSTEYGGTNHASAVLSDGIGVYITQEDEYAKAISYLNGKYGDDALKNEKSLKEYVLDNGTSEDKELAEKLGNGIAKSVINEPCNDGNPQTENDIYLDENFTCEGKKIYNSVKCEGELIGSEILVDGVNYLVVDDNTIRDNLSRAETLCTSNVTNMASLFYKNASFNQPIGNWDTSNVTNMIGMFYAANAFNQELNFDTSNVTDMSWMFGEASVFNQKLNFDTSNVTDMSGMFGDTKDFNQPLNFNTSNVTTMESMFIVASSFNQELNFDTSNVTNMQKMFYNAIEFNQPLNFDTSKVTDMSYMFSYAESFNQPLNFNTSKITNMEYMFNNAIAFNQDLSKWCVSKIGSKPINFDVNTNAWDKTSRQPEWGTCPVK